jgi:hypothetical protein
MPKGSKISRNAAAGKPARKVAARAKSTWSPCGHAGKPKAAAKAGKASAGNLSITRKEATEADRKILERKRRLAALAAAPRGARKGGGDQEALATPQDAGEPQPPPKWQAALEEVRAVVQAGGDAAALGPHARALLRGIEIQERDLAAAGGAYDLSEVEKVLRVTRQRVHQLVQQGDILAVPGSGGRARYPAVQFAEDARYGRVTVLEGLKAVRDALGDRNPWLMLNYLVRPDPRLGGRTPLDVLRAGEVAAAVAAARRVGEMGS